MSHSHSESGIATHRLSAEAYHQNFSDLHPALDGHEALVAADRCYFCYDAPCITACPTDIDIPLFIRQIATGTADAAAKTILTQNILGGMCARVCPTETLCEEACVREAAEGKPVEIGRLQRYATDSLMNKGAHPFKRAAETGKTIAVIGAGPAGLACAHRLAMHGHNVSLFDAQQKAGGLNEFGIAAYKSTNDFAADEVDWLLQIGGIQLHLGQRLGQELQLPQLLEDHDAVFLGMGLGGVNALGLPSEQIDNVENAVEFIHELRQSENLAALEIGRNIVVIGGGMTAVDASVQAKLLGAEHVHLVYRRGRAQMNASLYEQDLAATKGVNIIANAEPIAVHGNGAVREIEFAYTRSSENGLERTGETFRLAADQVFKAIGQTLHDAPAELTLEGRKIAVSENGQTSHPKVWAGGDCAAGGEDLTVTAVAQGRDAAENIHQTLMG